MYNRYVPQPDGTYSRSRLPDSPQRKSPPPGPPLREESCPPPAPPPEPRVSAPIHRQRPHDRRKEADSDILTFLRRLLPRDFDSGDLLVVLLLLLMSGDCREDQNTALLTLALYLFL